MFISACRIQHTVFSHLSRYPMACLLALCVMAVTQLAVAQNGTENNERAAIEIVAIEHRDPLLVRNRIAPSLDPRGSIGIVDNKLLIASTAGNLAQLKTLIEQADIPARRLVLSIDFAHNSVLPSAAAQQSMQTVEGEQIRFVAPAAGNVAQALPGLSMNASMIGDMARVDIDIVNVPGFTGRHQLSLTPGEWYVINPEEEALLETALTPGLDAPADFAAADLAAGLMSTQPVESVPVQSLTVNNIELAPIAVRVDVLP